MIVVISKTFPLTVRIRENYPNKYRPFITKFGQVIH